MTLLEALINQGNSKDDAMILIKEMAENVINGEDPEEELWAFGLEPDYVMDLLEYCI